nr:uncharacterized protein LOC119179464 [Rhipicephalus microplus]
MYCNVPKGSTTKAFGVLPEMGFSGRISEVNSSNLRCRGAPSRNSGMDAAPSTTRLPDPPILGIPFVCKAESPIDATEVYAGAVEHVNIKSEPMSPLHFQDSHAFSPSECFESIYPTSVASSSADCCSSLPSTIADFLDLPVEPGCPAGSHSMPSVMPVQSLSAVKSSPPGSPCRDIGSINSDDSQNIDLTPEATVSRLEHEQDSVSGVAFRETAGEGLQHACTQHACTGCKDLSNKLNHKRFLDRTRSLSYRAGKMPVIQKAEKEIAMLAARNASLRLEVEHAEHTIASLRRVLRDIVLAKFQHSGMSPNI